jgi:hypothetical protein
VSLSDVQHALDEARRAKASLESSAGPAFKARDGYADTMRGFDQMLVRAAKAGAK